MRVSNELKVGVVVVAAVSSLLGMLFAVSGKALFHPTYRVQALFNFTAGLERHAPVRLAGVHVGEVEEIRLDVQDETKAVVTLRLKNPAQIRQDSRILIGTLGLMGEKYIEVTRGSRGAPFVAPGSTLTGEDPFQLEELIETGQQVARQLDAALVEAQRLLKDLDDLVVSNREETDAILANLRDSSENLKSFTEDVRRHPWKLLIKTKEKAPPAAPKAR